MSTDKKYCPKCESWKKPEEFYQARKPGARTHPWCKQCASAYRKQWRKDRSEVARSLDKRYRKKRYGLVEGEFDSMFLAQKGVCLICGQPETRSNQHGTMTISIDHHHGTGRVRGLLCSACNTAIGLLQDDPKIIRRAAAYVQAFNSSHEDPHQLLLNLRSIGGF